MGVKLVSPSGGSVEIVAPTTASSYTATMPATTGNVVLDSATQTLTNKSWSSPAGSTVSSGTAQTSTSGTSIDFTGIPSWAKRITVMYSGVSTNGSSQTQVQIGTGGTPATSGYAGSVDSTTTGVSAATFTTGLGLIRSGLQAIASVMQGQVVFTNVSGNTWVGTNLGALSNTGVVMFGGTSITLGGVLNIVRFTTVNGTDLFDAGTINILWE